MDFNDKVFRRILRIGSAVALAYIAILLIQHKPIQWWMPWFLLLLAAVLIGEAVT